jgi:formate dehydrogenase (NADP+) beta subunit
VTPATTFLKEYNLDPETRISGVVAVIGGGSTAMDAARSALRAGASEVHIVYRRTQAEMPAQKEEVRAALAEGIQLHELAAPTQMLGEGRVSTLRCQRMTLSDPDEQGRRKPVAMPDQDFELPCDHVLVAIGEAPDPSFLPAGTSVEVGAWGGLLINPQTLATGAPGVFAAGDVTYGPKSIIHAAAHGRLAARSIHAYLRKLNPGAVSEMPDDDVMTTSLLAPDGVVPLDLRAQPREELPLAGRDAAHDRSVEFVGGFSEEQARREASRCLRCDLAYLCPTVHVVGAPEPAHAGR